MKEKTQGERQKEKFTRPNYQIHPIQMLLYKSFEHYNFWRLIGDLKPEEREKILREGIDYPRERFLKFYANLGVHLKLKNCPEKYEIPTEFLKPPTIINSIDFTKEDFEEICRTYTLFDSEKEKGACPFCRCGVPGQAMLILSETVRAVWGDSKNIKGSMIVPNNEGTLERGGSLMMPCICQSFRN